MIDVLNIARDRLYIFSIFFTYRRDLSTFLQSELSFHLINHTRLKLSDVGLSVCSSRVKSSNQSETKIKQHVWRVNQTSGVQIDLIENNTLNFSVLT